MRRGILSDLQGNTVGAIIENDDGTLTGEGVGRNWWSRPHSKRLITG